MTDWEDFKPVEKPKWLEDGPGNYPWDRWEERARGAGIEDDLAALGRAVYREAYNHGWDRNLQSECGWSDDGERMLQYALIRPEVMRAWWQYLLDTDGERIDALPPGPGF